ncbi:MAG: hypothetical protein KBG85_13680 [Micropruina sp.]|nr:hypothetical protein [Micropruina sp.]
MRTTVTLDPDTEALVRRLMAERGVSFKRALNDAIRAGAEPRTRQAFRTRTRAMGQPAMNLDRALQIAAGEEDDELVRRLRVGT